MNQIFLSGLILPRGAHGGSYKEPCFIMWSRSSSFDTERVFQPNHFVTMIEEQFIMDKVKPSYSDIVRGSTVRHGQLERSRGQTFSCIKKKQSTLKTSKVESNKAGTGQHILLPTQSTNSQGKMKKHLEERKSGGLSASFSPPKTHYLPL